MERQELLNEWSKEFVCGTKRYIIVRRDGCPQFISDLVRDYHLRWDLGFPSDYLYEIIKDCLEHDSSEWQDECEPVPIYDSAVASKLSDNTHLITLAFEEKFGLLEIYPGATLINLIQDSIRYIYADCLQWWNERAEEYLIDLNAKARELSV